MRKIAVFGAGGLGREIALMIEQINKAKPEWEIIGFIDDDPDQGTDMHYWPVVGDMEWLNRFPEKLGVVIAIARTEVKEKIYRNISNPLIYFPSLIHPSVIKGGDWHIRIGEGSLITAGTILTTNIRIGKHVLINLGCTVGHDVAIKDFASIMPGVHISGEVVVEEKVFIGTGASIINRLSIGKNAIVGAGAVVCRSVPSDCTAVGVPARPIKFHQPIHNRVK